MKRILVTGGLGFMGSHFIKRLLKKHRYEILNIDKLTYAGNKKNLEGIGIQHHWVKLDICHERVMEVMMSFKPQIIINFAAETHVDRSIRDPLAFTQTDINGLVNLILNARRLDCLEKFIHISTDEVYGPALDSRMTFQEDAPLNPTSPYSSSKAAGDLIFLSYMKTYGFPGIIVRPCNNYGTHQYPEKLIPMSITRLMMGEPILCHGTGEEVREWIHVHDFCRALDAVVHKGKIGEIYNIGSYLRLPNRKVMNIVIECMLALGAINWTNEDFSNYIQNVPNRPGNDARYAIGSNKVRMLQTEYVRTDFYAGILQAVEWYRDNKDWWGKINLDANIYKEGEYLR